MKRFIVVVIVLILILGLGGFGLFLTVRPMIRGNITAVFSRDLAEYVTAHNGLYHPVGRILALGLIPEANPVGQRNNWLSDFSFCALIKRFLQRFPPISQS